MNVCKKRLLKILGLENEEGLTQEMLDTLVHDYKSYEASNINEQGEDAQIIYILEQM